MRFGNEQCIMLRSILLCQFLSKRYHLEVSVEIRFHQPPIVLRTQSPIFLLLVPMMRCPPIKYITVPTPKSPIKSQRKLTSRTSRHQIAMQVIDILQIIITQLHKRIGPEIAIPLIFLATQLIYPLRFCLIK